LKILDELGAVSVNELYHRLPVSRETIRRDLAQLAALQKLRKTHGGALAMNQSEPAFAERLGTNIRGKQAIGRMAARLVPDGASLMINSGTTALCLADALGSRERLVVYTNDIHVAGRFAGNNGNRVVLLGGELQGAEGATLGRDTMDCLSNYFADFCFVGASALNAEPLLSDFSRDQAAFHAAMIGHARIPVLLIDHTKFDKRAPVRVANLDKIRHLVTDRRMGKTLSRSIEMLKIDVQIARN